MKKSAADSESGGAWQVLRLHRAPGAGAVPDPGRSMRTTEDEAREKAHGPVPVSVLGGLCVLQSGRAGHRARATRCARSTCARTGGDATPRSNGDFRTSDRFQGDDDEVLAAEPAQYPGTRPELAVTRAQARLMCQNFDASGHSNHSGRGCHVVGDPGALRPGRHSLQRCVRCTRHGLLRRALEGPAADGLSFEHVGRDAASGFRQSSPSPATGDNRQAPPVAMRQSGVSCP